MRTTTIDPLCEKYYDISPYAWCGNNTVNVIDTDGKRFYDSRALIGWLSVDPLADKYPHISSYAYCAWNPLKYFNEHGIGSVKVK